MRQSWANYLPIPWPWEIWLHGVRLPLHFELQVSTKSRQWTPKSYITLKMTMETTRGNMSIMQNFVLKLRPFKVNRLFSDNPCQKYWGHWGKLQKFVLMSAGDFIKSICWVIHPPPPNSMLDRRFPTKIDQHWVGGDGGNRPRNEILLNHWCVPMFLARIVWILQTWLC